MGVLTNFSNEIGGRPNQIRWGVLGTARINNRILPAIQGQQNQTLRAVASRDSARAQQYAREWGFECSFGSYQDLLNSPEVNAVYISLPNQMHFEWSRAALLAGKHVLCEKPLAMSAGEVSELSRRAAENDLVLTEGFMYRHHKQIEFLKSFLVQGGWGELRSASVEFHYQLSNDNDVRWLPELADGVLNDLGCYVCNLFQLIFRELPQNVQLATSWKRGVDSSVRGVLDFENHRRGDFAISFDGEREDSLRLEFEKANVLFPHIFKGGRIEEIVVDLPGSTRIVRVEDSTEAYERQVVNFARGILMREPLEVNSAESVTTAQWLELLGRRLGSS